MGEHDPDEAVEQHRRRGAQVRQRDAEPVQGRLVLRTVVHVPQPRSGRTGPIATRVDLRSDQGRLPGGRRSTAGAPDRAPRPVVLDPGPMTGGAASGGLDA
ncbi:hypothetical protein Ppa06_34740 [Planomonospora parontospora subsp. parontospora]|uniref:Uncharacterized protein n=2 Tax=Planomonospora parontospora TaxID=58119 RepID=A0AA37F555_9ACTN|nr:hypothetical protein GCM10010126_36340 [Planomonospora parontospora]GII09676.1 hypothetical protein Ppa06_34740 [Planomonospora parontospora subsp. parontospora]